MRSNRILTLLLVHGELLCAASLRVTQPRMAGFGTPKPKKAKGFEGKKTFEEQMTRYNALRVEGYPPPNVADVYVHKTDAPKFWFVGKVLKNNLMFFYAFFQCFWLALLFSQ